MAIDLRAEAARAAPFPASALAAARDALRAILEAFRNDVAEARRIRPHYAYPLIGL
jgi:hypothetical protein